MDSAPEPLHGWATKIFTGLNLAIHPALYLSSLQDAVILPLLQLNFYLWQIVQILFDLSASSAFVCFFMSKKRLSKKKYLFFQIGEDTHVLKNVNFCTYSRRVLRFLSKSCVQKTLCELKLFLILISIFFHPGLSHICNFSVEIQNLPTLPAN